MPCLGSSVLDPEEEDDIKVYHDNVVISERDQGSSSPSDPGAVKTILPQETDEVEEKTG